MLGLVEEIQVLSLDPNVRISDLLRRVKLAAVKLNLQDAVEWVDLELKGYEEINEDEIPKYRWVSGRLMELTPHWGTRPAFGDPEMISFLSFSIIKHSITKLDELSLADGRIAIPVDANIQTQLLERQEGYPRSYHVEFDKSMLIGIMSRVRDLVLDWACSLEKQGILGEGISFSMEEKQKAAMNASQITINYGLIHNGDNNGDQQKTVVGSVDNSVNTMTIDNLFEQVNQAVRTQINEEKDRNEILQLLNEMRASHGSAEYKPLFQKWVGYMAEYATVLGPFVAALGA